MEPSRPRGNSWNAPNAEPAATTGPKKTSPTPMTRASPAVPRIAMSGSRRRRSIFNPERAVSFRARSQLMPRA
ncbi:hypothetical protein ABZV67_23765 [Streptomyces sp. NPDC005065]|uniref:hypothetical protein n=1 Tax=unclassified Streptomyces TaxID=2593676 RepID=UPI0033A9CF91